MTPVSELQGFLPHSDNMVWIDYVLETSETGGSCLVVVDKNKHYANAVEVRQSSFVEWMAQGFGFVNAKVAKDSGNSQSVSKAFLVGFNNITFSDFQPIDKEELLITTHVKRVIGPISYIEGKIISRNTGTLYCEGQLKLFSN
ncbi:MAG: hypothetical protein K2Q18_16855 [Bdellovibrionales bacterium]|nr:hypothetical protein [Bdellovibrionales bacterium]